MEEENETPPAAPEKYKYRRLSEAEWAEAKALYETGKLNKTDLAGKYGISRQAIHEGLVARGAVYGSKSSIVEQATIDAQKDSALKKVEEIDAFKEKQKKMVEMVQNLTIKAVTDRLREKKPAGDAKNDVITLRHVMATIAMGRDELYHLYDLHRDPDAGDQIEEFIVSEYTPEEIEALNHERLGISGNTDADLAEVAASLEDKEGSLDDLLGDV